MGLFDGEPSGKMAGHTAQGLSSTKTGKRSRWSVNGLLSSIRAIKTPGLQTTKPRKATGAETLSPFPPPSPRSSSVSEHPSSGSSFGFEHLAPPSSHDDLALLAPHPLRRSSLSSFNDFLDKRFPASQLPEHSVRSPSEGTNYEDESGSILTSTPTLRNRILDELPPPPYYSQPSEDDSPDTDSLEPHGTSIPLSPHDDILDRTQPVLHPMPGTYGLPTPSTYQNGFSASNTFLSSLRWEGILGAFTPYLEMSKPSCDFDRVLKGLLSEWSMISASLLGSAALNGAVLGYSSPSFFNIDGIALKAVTVGTIASAIGLVTDVWFIVVYNGVGPDQFRQRAQDVFGTYIFFSLSCRIPTLCLFVAVCSFLSFIMAATAPQSSYTAIAVTFGTLASLWLFPYLLYSCHKTTQFCVKGGAEMVYFLVGLCFPSQTPTVTVEPPWSYGPSTVISIDLSSINQGVSTADRDAAWRHTERIITVDTNGGYHVA